LTRHSSERPAGRLRPGRTGGWTAASLLLLASCAPDAATTQGEEIADLYRLFVYAAIGVGGITCALILWVAVRYRRRADDLPTQSANSMPFEIVYTVLPVLIVAGLFVATFGVERSVDRIDPQPEVLVNVTGFQWQWRFDYPEHGVSIIGVNPEEPTLVLPVSRRIRIHLSSPDVIHSFYVPEFLFKRDAIPGQPNDFDWVIPETGRFRGACAEYCGLEHAEMNFWVQAVTPAEFDAWVERERAR
jgi:cytochrome c oxidase subunit II